MTDTPKADTPLSLDLDDLELGDVQAVEQEPCKPPGEGRRRVTTTRSG